MPHKKGVELLLLLLLAATAASCTTMGTGIGYTPSGASPTAFSWRSSDAHSGTMQATLSDGTNYRGKYYQITRDKKFDSTTLFDGWYTGWDETDWGVGPSPDFVAYYTDASSRILPHRAARARDANFSSRILPTGCVAEAAASVNCPEEKRLK